MGNAQTTVNLDPDTFGNTPACRILVEKLNRANNAALARTVSTQLTNYFIGLREIMKMVNPTRDLCIDLWADRAKRLAEEHMLASFERHGIDLSYVRNIIHHKKRQAKLHGAIIQRFNEDSEDHGDWKLVLMKIQEVERRGLLGLPPKPLDLDLVDEPES